jgi:NAD-dependent deacetylase
MSADIDKLAHILHKSKMSVAFTGAGISAESGIPTYRDDDGLWKKYDPDKCVSIQGFMNDPRYYWTYFREVRYPCFKKAKPNNGHKALSDLEKMGKLDCVITQNVDGLHQEAGSKNVIELHGNTRVFYCLDCKKEYSIDEAYIRLEKGGIPHCDCGGLLRPAVVFFGEPLPITAFNRAKEKAERCDVMMAIGSSLQVYPAAGLLPLAKERGALVAVIDKKPVQGYDLNIVGPAAEVLPKIVDAVRKYGKE